MERIGVWNVDSGYYFRVWAPHAQKVSVLIEQGPYWANETSDTLLERALVYEKSYWRITVADNKPWQLYCHQLILPNGTVVECLTPAARDVPN